ncbi:MAG: CRP-like cAMP-binding protein [Candidatus Marinamargulisbacteria bacterium]
MKEALLEVLDTAFDLYPEDAAERALLLKLGHVVELKKGAKFIMEGEKADNFYIIVKGNVRITMDAYKTPVTIYTAAAGEMVGWSSLVEPRLYKGNGISDSDVTLLKFETHELRAEMKANPKLGYLVMYRVSQFLSTRLLHSMFELVSEFADQKDSVGA